MVASTKNRIVSGMFWTFGSQLFMQLGGFVIGIILARMLSPDDYGLVGMLSIFMAIAQSLLDSGFSNALVQKKDRTGEDYSTVFYFNIGISVLLYAILYLSAPYIAKFYDIPLLTRVTRIIALSIIINGLTIVQTAKLTVELNFRLQFVSTASSMLLSGALGIYLAYSGLGVWALVWQSVSYTFIKAVVLWVFSHWHPQFTFSVASFKSLFSYGSKLLVSGLLHTVYTNLYTLTIGKAFKASDVGYYNRANGYGLIPYNVFSQAVNNVIFPVLSEMQDDNERLLYHYQKMMRIPMYVYVPLMFGIAVLSPTLIEILIGSKWLPCAIYMQILCLGYTFAPLSSLNLNLLYVKGRSDITLKLDLIKKPIGIVLLFATLPFGLTVMCIGKAVYELVAFALNCYYTKKILNFGLILQLKNVIVFFLYAAVMSVAVYFLAAHCTSLWVKLLGGTATGVVVYLLLSVIFREKTLQELLAVLKERLKR